MSQATKTSSSTATRRRAKPAARRGTSGVQISPATRSALERKIARRYLEILKTGGDVRKNKTRRLRAVVRMATYENDLKMQVAMERLMQEMTE